MEGGGAHPVLAVASCSMALSVLYGTELRVTGLSLPMHTLRKKVNGVLFPIGGRPYHHNRYVDIGGLHDNHITWVVHLVNVEKHYCIKNEQTVEQQ
jgi:hypothetical protein